jgi:hypothetical protein
LGCVVLVVCCLRERAILRGIFARFRPSIPAQLPPQILCWTLVYATTSKAPLCQDRKRGRVLCSSFACATGGAERQQQRWRNAPPSCARRPRPKIASKQPKCCLPSPLPVTILVPMRQLYSFH